MVKAGGKGMRIDQAGERDSSGAPDEALARVLLWVCLLLRVHV